MSSAVHVDVYDGDNVLICNLPRHRGAQWVHEANGDGTGSLQIHLDDQVLVDHPEILTAGNIIKVRPTGAAEDVFAWQIEQPQPTLTDSGEVEARWLTLTGRGVRSLLQLGTVYPEYGLRMTTSEDRAFDFSSADGDWRDPADWDVPVGVRQDEDPTARAHNPGGWPDPAAQWLWSTDPTATAAAGRNWFRGEFTLAADMNVCVYAAADNFMSLRLDGEVIATTDPSDPFAWRQMATHPVRLAAGVHTVAAWVDNYDAPGTNPGAFLCSVIELDSAGNPTTVRLRTTPDTFLVKAYGDPPGWHGAQIVDKLLTECQARGASPLDAVTLGFTGDLDSDGQPWTDIQDRSFRVSTDLLDVLNQVAELAMDVDMSPDLVLNAWVRRGADLSEDVELVAGDPADATGAGNITAQTPTLQYGAIRNCGLVRFGNGWLEVTEPTSLGAHGRRETGLSVGNANSVEQAQQVADAMFDELAVAQVTLPVQHTSVKGPQPYVDFVHGDTITAPGPLGTPGPARVMSIAGQDAETHVAWTTDLYPEVSRRPPSQRDPSSAGFRIDRASGQQVPGIGKMTNASPAGATGDDGAALVRGAGPTSSPGVRFAHDRFELATSTPTLTLTFLPAPNSAHVYLNGVEQDEGTDYTLTGRSLDVLTAMGAVVDDVLDVRYAYLSGLPLAPRDPGLEDTFDRADGPSEVANRSDGGTWTLPAGSDWEIQNNRLVATANTGGVKKIAADYEITGPIVITAEVVASDPYGDLEISWANDWVNGGAFGYSLGFTQFEQFIHLVDQTTTYWSSVWTLPNWEDLDPHTVQITYDPATGACTVSFDGVEYFSDTLPVVPAFTGLTLDSNGWGGSPDMANLNGFNSISVLPA